eukprot:SAG31_NODE_3829_length_3842_cov_124.370558_4_plen_164_part_00
MGCYFLSHFCATIREIRDFNREKFGTNRESVCINRAEAAAAAQSEMLMLRRAMCNESEDDDDGVGGQLMALQAVTQTEAADTSEIESLLRQLVVEPTEDAERVAKFKLYEELMETVEAARKSTFDFYAGCADDFAEAGGANVQAAIEQKLKAIDGGDNMAVGM